MADHSSSTPPPPPSPRRHVALYPGSFDPITFGHLDVIRRGRRLFDTLVVGVGRNPEKQTLFTPDERYQLVARLGEEIVAEEPDAADLEVVAYGGLTFEFAREIGATVLLRGIRNLSDLQTEVQQAVTNRQVAKLETTFIVAGESFAYISSSLIRQVTAMGDDLSVLSTMCPPGVIDALRAKQIERPDLLRSLQDEP